MRAAVFVGTGEDLVVTEVEPRALRPHDVRVRVDASGVCRSDLAIRNGAVPMPPPTILGHEGAGTVIETGDDVAHVSPGDRVIGSFVPACGRCPSCVAGRTNHCETLMTVAMRRRAHLDDRTPVFAMSGLGTFADTMTCDEASLVRVESDLPAEQLALIGCGVMTGVGSVLNTARVEPGSTVAVFGCGGVGLSVVQGARIVGASHIVAIDPIAMKRDAAIAVGATAALDPTAVDVPHALADLTGGGVDYAFEVVGRPETIVAAYQATRPRGTVVAVGMPAFDSVVALPAYSLFFEEKQIKGSNYGSADVRRDFPRIVTMAESGQLDLESLITRRIGLDAVNDAFRALEAGEVLRTVITSF